MLRKKQRRRLRKMISLEIQILLKMLVIQRKLKLRTEFFRRFLSSCRIHMVNTILPAKETQAKIREALGVE